MQAKPFNNIPTTKFNHLPPLKTSLLCATRLPTNQLRDPPTSVVETKRQVGTVPKDNSKTRASDEYKSLFTSQRRETSEPVKLALVDGSMPKEFPNGTYYLVGPGLFTDDHGSTVSPLDGHGYLRAFEINGANGEVNFSARYVKTEAQMEEFDPAKGSWKFTHRGPFSVLKGSNMVGNMKVMKDVANTTVLKWGGRLFCLWEGGAPYEVHPRSLATLGRFDLIRNDDEDDNDNHDDSVDKATLPGVGGVLLDVLAALVKPVLHGMFKMPRKRILSHYKIDVQRQRLLIMACNAEDMLLPRSCITFYEFDTNFKLIHEQEFKMGDQLMVHDWGFTDTHYLVFGNRVKLDIPGLAVASCGLSPMISAVSPNPSNSTSPLYLLPRGPEAGGGLVEVELPSQMWTLHVANASEQPDKDDGHGNRHLQIHAIACSYKWFSFTNMFGYEWQSGKFDPSMMNKEEEENMLPRLVQVCVDLDSSTGKCTNSSVEVVPMWTRSCDFPVINTNCHGTGHQYIYVATSSGSHQALPNFPFDTIVKLDTRNTVARAWSTARGRFIGEPMFVPKTISVQEDDGYLVVVEYAVSQGRCYLVIIDAKQIGESSPLVARFAVPKALTFPLGFHGVWDPLQSY